MPTVASPAKIARIRESTAELVAGGDRLDSEACVAQTGAVPVHAFDQVETLLGQGTLAMELAAQAPALDPLLVPVGGGGLIGGIARGTPDARRSSASSRRTRRHVGSVS